MLGWKLVEGQQRRFVFGQAFGRLRVFRCIGLEEGIERQVSVLARVCHPDLVQVGFRFRLQILGQLVQHICRLVYPAALLARRAKHLGQRFPEA